LGKRLNTSFQASSSSEGISLYIHLPFAKAYVLLWLQAYHQNHGVENPYIEAVLKEWTLYCKILEKPTIKEIHLGGGTPTFFF
jgi:oxygen-independent coproporphyrinogen-3 oxidase